MEIQNKYTTLIEQIKETVNIGRVSAVKAARRQMVLTYWAVGRHIIEFNTRTLPYFRKRARNSTEIQVQIKKLQNHSNQRSGKGEDKNYSHNRLKKQQL